MSYHGLGLGLGLGLKFNLKEKLLETYVLVTI